MNTPIDLERILTQYHNDQFIEGCKQQIEMIISMSIPKVKLNLTGDCLYDFEMYQDEETSKRIQFWIDSIMEYTKYNFPEIETNGKVN